MTRVKDGEYMITTTVRLVAMTTCKRVNDGDERIRNDN